MHRFEPIIHRSHCATLELNLLLTLLGVGVILAQSQVVHVRGCETTNAWVVPTHLHTLLQQSMFMRVLPLFELAVALGKLRDVQRVGMCPKSHDCGIALSTCDQSCEASSRYVTESHVKRWWQYYGIHRDKWHHDAYSRSELQRVDRWCVARHNHLDERQQPTSTGASLPAARNQAGRLGRFPHAGGVKATPLGQLPHSPKFRGAPVQPAGLLPRSRPARFCAADI